MAFSPFSQGGAIIDSEQFVPDLLFAGVHAPIVPDGGIIASGEGVVPRGAVLGEITMALGTIAYASGNTGKGTITGAALGKSAKVGNYVLVCRKVVGGHGLFEVDDPDGMAGELAQSGTAYSGPICFTIGDGSPEWAVGDTITFPVVAGSGYLRLVNSAHVDGSQKAICINGIQTDATEASQVASVYDTGEFNTSALTFGGEDTWQEHAAELRKVGIILKTNIAGSQG
jgi:hypothetical protein